MKKILIFLSLFIIISITTVKAITFDKTNEISWNFKADEWGNYNDILKYENDYIYTEYGYDNNKDQNYYKIVSKNNKGQIIWQKKITVDYAGEYDIDIILIDDKVFLTICDYETMIISAEDGTVLKESDDVFGYNIELFNNNILISNGDLLYIIDQDLNIQYKLDKSNIDEFWMCNIYVENNLIYVLTREDDYHYILELNEKLEMTKKTKLTYDNNQGFLSKYNGFSWYASFIKVGDNFYQIGNDVYKISNTGKVTQIYNSEQVNEFNQEKYYYYSTVIGENIVALENIWDEDYDTGYIRYTIYDKDFKVLSTTKISDIENKPYSWPASITPIENGFIVKWLDEYNSYNSNITEYKQNKAACKIVSGTGKNIGDEISCGTENFYIIENDGEKVKALSKYNLYVGKDYYKIDFGQTFTTYNDANNYFYNNYGSEYYDVERFLSNDDGYYGAIAYKYIETDKVLQDSKAIGAHGNLKVEPEFPELGVVSDYDGRSWRWLYFELVNSNLVLPYNDGYLDLPLDHSTMFDSYWLYVLEDYEQELSKQNISLDDISIISVSEINEIVKNITNKELPLKEWYNNSDSWGVVESEHTAGENIYIVGSIKEQMPEGYEWLWGTTYWTRTIDANYDDYQYFVDTAGDLCSIEYCEVSIGAGIRPVITMSVEELEYKIETKTDNKGTIEVKPSSGTGEEVQVTITPKKGYELKEVRVTDAEGNVLTFTNNTFIMPSSNVTIEAIFEVKNPNTSATNIILFILLGICAIFVMKNSKKRIQWLTT